MKPKRKRAAEAGTLVGIRLQPDLLSALDKWRRKEEDLPNRSEAIRRMMEIVTKGRKS